MDLWAEMTPAHSALMFALWMRGGEVGAARDRSIPSPADRLRLAFRCTYRRSEPNCWQVLLRCFRRDNLRYAGWVVNGVPSASIRCIMTASLRASATAASSLPAWHPHRRRAGSKRTS